MRVAVLVTVDDRRVRPNHPRRATKGRPTLEAFDCTEVDTEADRDFDNDDDDDNDDDNDNESPPFPPFMLPAAPPPPPRPLIAPPLLLLLLLPRVRLRPRVCACEGGNRR